MCHHRNEGLEQLFFQLGLCWIGCSKSSFPILHKVWHLHLERFLFLMVLLKQKDLWIHCRDTNLWFLRQFLWDLLGMEFLFQKDWCMMELLFRCLKQMKLWMNQVPILRKVWMTRLALFRSCIYFGVFDQTSRQIYNLFLLELLELELFHQSV